MKNIEVPEDFLQDRLKTTSEQRNNCALSEHKMDRIENSPLRANSDFKQPFVANGYRKFEKVVPLAVACSSDEFEATSQRVSILKLKHCL